MKKNKKGQGHPFKWGEPTVTMRVPASLKSKIIEFINELKNSK